MTPLPPTLLCKGCGNLTAISPNLELSNNLIFAFFVFSLPLPPLLPTPLYVSMQPQDKSGH